MAIRVGAPRLRENRNDVLDETELGFLLGRAGHCGREQQKRYAMRHRELSSAGSIFTSMGGETAEPARSRNDLMATGPVALRRNSIWLAPASNTLFSNLTPLSAGSGWRVIGPLPPSNRRTLTFIRATLPGVNATVCGGSSSRPGNSVTVASSCCSSIGPVIFPTDSQRY